MGLFFPSAPSHSFMPKKMFSLIRGLYQNKVYSFHICSVILKSLSHQFAVFMVQGHPCRKTLDGHLAEILLAESNIMNKPILEIIKCYHP